MGRRALPTNIKIFKGTAKKCRINENEPKPELIEVEKLEPPKDFEGIAYKIWVEYSKQLIETRVLSKTDVHNLEAFCRWWAIWKEAEQEVREKGTIIETNFGPKKNPAVNVLNEASKNVRDFGGALGLDPSSRTKINAPKKAKTTKFSDL